MFIKVLERFIIFKTLNITMKRKSFFGAAKGIGLFTEEDKFWIEGRVLKSAKKKGK